jgi:hypothetical protein
MTQAWAKWEKQVINGVFPLHRCVSFSDHSAVYLTEHGAHELPFALLKLVPAIPTLKETQLAQWTAAATLAHPHLVRLFEAGCCQLGSLQFLFVVTEYAEATLAETLTQRALTPDALRKGLRPILASLSFLHRRHLVQGGLKPSNILVVNQQVKLASDAVRLAGESAAGIAGSSVYDPPESRDGSFSTAGDVWSLGVFMVEALTQCRPSWPHKHAATPDLPATLSPLFEEIVRQCLNRNPDHRPTVAELAAAINPAAPQAPTESVSYPVLFPPEPPGPTPTSHRRRAGPGRYSATIAQTALIRPGRDGDSHRIDRGLDRLAAAGFSGLLKSYCVAGGQFAQSSDCYVCDLRDLRSRARPWFRKTRDGSRSTIRAPRRGPRRSARRTRDDSRPYQVRGSCERRSLGQCRPRHPGKSQPEQVFHPAGH